MTSLQNRPFFSFRWLHFYCSIIIGVSLSHSFDGRGEELLILTPPNQEHTLRPLQNALNSQLADYDVNATFYLYAAQRPLDEAIQSDAVKIQSETGNFAILWLSELKFFLYVRKGDEQFFISRPLPNTDSTWEVQCDAIASVIHAMLSTWLTTSEEDNDSSVLPDTGNPEAESKLLTESNEKKDDENNLAEEQNIPPSSLNAPGVGIGVAYSPYLMSSNNLWVNGAVGFLHIRIHPKILLGAEVGFALKTEDPFRLRRIPIRLNAAVLWKRNQFSFGTEASVVLDATNVSAQNGDNPRNSKVLYIGAGASVLIQFKLTEQLSTVLKGGVDFYNASNYYWYDNRLSFYYGPLQGTVAAGIIFWLQ